MTSDSNEGNVRNGKIALEIIMSAMENHREDLIVIFAGYEDEIEKMVNGNPGIRSRINHTFVFESFTPLELVEIAKMMLSHKFNIQKVENELKKVIEQRINSGKMSGNARDVRNLVQEIIDNHKVSIMEDRVDPKVISAEDVLLVNKKVDYRNKEGMDEVNKQARSELDNLIGLKTIKEEMTIWANYIQIERQRVKLGASVSYPTMHMIYTGNPGTGKTTVARIIGKLLKSNGVLSKGHFTEVTRSDLVGQWQGETAIKTKEVIRKSLGGVLFIDEAYSFYQSERDHFGKEAIDTLISEMEDHRDELIVILAGYEEDMDHLINANPGFDSRISNVFHFPDYNAEELFSLFNLNLTSLKFIIGKEALNYANSAIEYYYGQGKINGNGRWVRNMVDRVKKIQANRLVKEGSVDYFSITKKDIELTFDKV